MKKYNVAVVGCGGMSGGWVNYAKKRDDVDIKLFVDINLDMAKERRDSNGYKNAEVAVRLDENIIKELGINLVFDVTIPDAHYDVVTTALKAGCDVFGEKPMSSNIENARKMVATAKETGRKYFVMQNYRYNKEIRGYKELISQDVIGTLGTLQADFYLDPNFGGFRAEMESPLILDMAIHTFDMSRFLSGADAVSVYCQEYNPKWSYYKGDISAVVIFEMDNGAVFTYNGSWAAKGCGTSWNGHWRAIGERGTALWDGGNNTYAEILVNNESTKVVPKYTWNHQNQNHDGCFDDMFAALIGGYDTETVCTDNIKSIEMVFGAIKSSRTGQKVLLK